MVWGYSHIYLKPLIFKMKNKEKLKLVEGTIALVHMYERVNGIKETDFTKVLDNNGNQRKDSRKIR